jgi:pimeloyl-ACP methyl ester carboxylesterase
MNANSEKIVYLLSGLGTDERVFDYLDLKEYKTKYIDWIAPLEDETIESYATRLLEQINTDKPVLIGVSFGGIMAIEIAKLIEVQKVIQISSIGSCEDLPTSNRWIGFFKLNKLIPTAMFNTVNDALYWFFSAESDREKEILKTIVEESDPAFIEWGIDKIVNWEHKERLEEVVSIHGTEDRIFPEITADYPVEKGGHLMIINRSKEISSIIKKIMEGLKK